MRGGAAETGDRFAEPLPRFAVRVLEPVGQEVEQLVPFLCALAGAAAGEEGGDDGVAGQADWFQRLIRHGQLLLLGGRREVVARFEDRPAGGGRGRHSLTDFVLDEAKLGGWFQIETDDLPAVKPHERVAGPQAVVEERKGVILGQRGQP